MKPVVVGLLGRAGSGKSTAAKHLENVFQARRFLFSKPLKEFAKVLYDFTDEQVYGTQEQKEAIDPRWGFSPRTGMIRIGDGGRNTLGKKLWINACFDSIEEDYFQLKQRPKGNDEIEAYTLYVIEDMRYPNEAGMLREDPRFHGRVVKLICPDSVSTAFVNAPSELSVDAVPEFLLDGIITSHRSPDSIDLKDKITELFGKLFLEIDRIGDE